MAESKKADLVLEGGGVKGIGLVGAVTKLVEDGYTFERVAGTSAGAIVAAAVAAGVSPATMRKKLAEVGTKFLDAARLPLFPLVGFPLALLKDYGFFRGEAFREWMAELLGNIRFGDLRRPPNGGDDKSPDASPSSYKLVVMTTDVVKGKLVRLPWHYAEYGLDPDKQLVADAVRMSMSIPFFFVPARLKDDLVVDGGLVSNFPIDVFDRRDGQTSRWPTIGIKLSSAADANQIETRYTGLAGFVERVVVSALNGNDRMHLSAEAAKRTIFVDTDSVSPIDFALSEETKEMLFQTGYSAATRWVTPP